MSMSKTTWGFLHIPSKKANSVISDKAPVLTTFPIRPPLSREKHPRQSLNRLSSAIDSKYLIIELHFRRILHTAKIGSPHFA